jgi:hypothetical protein
MAVDSVLSQADYTKLNTGLARIQSALDQLAKAKECGLDMDEPIAMLEAQQYTIQQLKRNFFPDRS